MPVSERAGAVAGPARAEVRRVGAIRQMVLNPGMTREKRWIRPAIGTGLLLLIPLVMTILDRGKPEGEGWHWGLGDFVVAGTLLFGAGLLYEYLAGRARGRAGKLAAGAAIFLAVFAIWFELAVDGVSKVLVHVLG